MTKQGNTSLNVRKLTYLAVLSALVVVLQAVIAPMIGAATGLSPALVLVPIVLGAAICGVGGGAWLGAVFSIIVLFDPTTVPFLQFNPVLTVLLVFAKGAGSGALVGLIFNLISKKNKYIAVVVSAISAPILNTGIFVLGCILFFSQLTGFGVYTLFISVNFLVELIVNITIVPVVYYLLGVTRAFDMYE